MEKPDFILNLSEEDLFIRLGEVDFQLEKYGRYNPNLIFDKLLPLSTILIKTILLWLTQQWS